MVHLAALARRHGVRLGAAVARGLRRPLGGGEWPRSGSGTARVLRGLFHRQDDRHHAHRAARVSRWPNPRPPDGDLRPPAPLPVPAARDDARLARRLMAQLAVETLLDGVLRTLREAVLPAVAGRFARGQLFAVLDVLQNLRDRVEWKAAFDDAEASSAGDALRRMVDLVGTEAAAPVARALAAAPAGPPAARAAAL